MPETFAMLVQSGTNFTFGGKWPDVVTVIATQPLTTEEPWVQLAPRRLHVFERGEQVC